jgi:predicted permease
MLAQFLQDLRFGGRNLSRNPGFAAIAVLSLALGIMATTAMYSVIYGVVIDPFPYKDVDNLASVKVWSPGQRGSRVYYSTDQFLEIARRSTVFQGVVASTISDVVWTGDGEPQRLRGNHGTLNTFDVMGVAPLIGRTPVAADGAPGAPPVAVLGYKFWQRQFGGDPTVLGRKMRLNGVVRTVIGVMPKRFMWRGADVYLPLAFHPGEVNEGVRMVHLLGRLKPGITAAKAEADLAPIIADLKRREPAEFPEQWRVGLLSFKETFPSSLREALWILFGAVGVLLLIACANVSSLLLARAMSRQREMAMRASLGAGRGRLMRQLLTENLVLAAVAGVVGVVLAFFALRAVIAIVPPDTIPDESEIAINTPVLLFTLAVSAAATLISGLAPALHASATNLAAALKESGRGSTGSRRHSLVTNGVVAAEVALSLMLLVGASLMIRTLLAIEHENLGIRTDHLLSLRVPMSKERYPDPARRTRFIRELAARVSASPGVVSVGVNTFMHPFGNMSTAVVAPGSAQQDTRRVLIHQVNEDYLRTYGIGLVRGRAVLDSEMAARQHLALANQAFVHRYLEGRAALGALVRIPEFGKPPASLESDSFEIVGVVKDTVNRGLTSEVMPELYVPYTLTGMADRLVVFTRTDPAVAANAVRREVLQIDPDQPVMEVKTMEQWLNDFEYSGPRFNLALFTIFAALGLTLAAVGVYGIVSNAVSRQTHELGVRVALGASFADIAGMVLRGGLKLMLAGIALGLAGSFATSRLLAQQLWNVSPFDPLSFALVSLLLLAVGLQACFWPARRAARVDPVTALRCE